MTYSEMDDLGWLNARDSLLHALDHFVELRGAPERKWHHQKWAIISVHHAASCLVVQWLRVAEANHPVVEKSRKPQFPHLDEAIKELRAFTGTDHLTKAEEHLLVLLKRLNSVRNSFIHRLPPKQIDNDVLAFAATSMIGLLHSVSRRQSKSFNELFEEFPEIRRDVVEAIHYSRIQDYGLYIERLLADQYAPHQLHQCPSCAAHTVVGSMCEACFEDLETMSCGNCEEEFHVLSYSAGQGFEQECPACGWIYRA